MARKKAKKKVGRPRKVGRPSKAAKRARRKRK